MRTEHRRVARRQRLDRLVHLDDEASAAPIASAIPAEPAGPPPLPRPDPDPQADARWQRVLAVVRPQLSMLDYFGVEDAVAVGGDDATLVLAVTNDIASRALQRALPRLESVLAAHDGRATTIRVVVSRLGGASVVA